MGLGGLWERGQGANLVSPGAEVKSIGDFGESLVDFGKSLVDFSQSLVDFEKLSGRPETSLGGAGDCSLEAGQIVFGRKGLQFWGIFGIIYGQ